MAEIERLLEHDTAGDPMTGLRWMRKTTAKVAAQLSRLGIQVSARTVARMLRKLRFSLRVNQKKLGTRHPDRDRQFRYIGKLRQRFRRQGNRRGCQETENGRQLQERGRQVGSCTHARQRP
jgi:hypothetical protein